MGYETQVPLGFTLLPIVLGTPVGSLDCESQSRSAVKVTLVGETVPSVVSLLARLTVTVFEGLELSWTVKVSVPPPSVVTRPDEGLSVMPYESDALTSAESGRFITTMATTRIKVFIFFQSFLPFRLGILDVVIIIYPPFLLKCTI
jgi:hypothetical protein